MVKMETLIKFINSEKYTKLVERLEKMAGIDVNKETPSFTILNYDLSRLNSAKVNIAELEKLIDSDEDKVLFFSRNKLKIFENICNEQEFEKGEELNEEEEGVHIRILPFYKDFLVVYLIEYFLLKTFPSDLKAYLKAVRIPNYKKYERELINIFDNIQNKMPFT